MRRFTVFFAIFLIAVIILADAGPLNGALEALHSIPYGDKVVHFLLVGLLNFLIISSLIKTYPYADLRFFIVVVSLALMFVFTLEEASQGIILGRNASLKDLLANYAGILFFGWLKYKLT